MLSLLLVSSLAFAAPVGDPVPDVDASRLRVAGVVDAELTRVLDTVCACDPGCRAQDQYVITGGEVQVNLVDGLAVVGTLGRARDHVDEADFDSTGIGLGLGVKGALPLSPVWAVFGQARFDHAAPGDAGPDAETATRSVVSLTGGMAWGAIESGFAGYLGVQGAVWYAQSVLPLGQSGIELPLEPTFPVSAVVGVSLASQALGTPWGGGPKLTTTIEGRAGQAMGAGLSMGLAF